MKADHWVVFFSQVLMSKGYGIKNKNTQLPVTPDTLFQIASLTKAFTSALLSNILAADSQWVVSSYPYPPQPSKTHTHTDTDTHAHTCKRTNTHTHTIQRTHTNTHTHIHTLTRSLILVATVVVNDNYVICNRLYPSDGLFLF